MVKTLWCQEIVKSMHLFDHGRGVQWNTNSNRGMHGASWWLNCSWHKHCVRFTLGLMMSVIALLSVPAICHVQCNIQRLWHFWCICNIIFFAQWPCRTKASIFLLLIERKGCTEQNLFYYEAEWLQLKECDSLIENTDSALLSDEMAHLLSSCLSVRVTAEKCGVRTVTEDQLATKADWQVTETGDKTWMMLHDKNLQELYQLTSDVKTL